mmetsp:Transcript_47017/g.92826  ORF Transcript_47017/g.92826 Transcript_47017/m.92826 type:complete len:210 (+) Transcript_47017:80-709(+)
MIRDLDNDDFSVEVHVEFRPLHLSSFLLQRLFQNLGASCSKPSLLRLDHLLALLLLLLLLPLHLIKHARGLCPDIVECGGTGDRLSLPQTLSLLSGSLQTGQTLLLALSVDHLRLHLLRVQECLHDDRGSGHNVLHHHLSPHVLRRRLHPFIGGWRGIFLCHLLPPFLPLFLLFLQLRLVFRFFLCKVLHVVPTSGHIILLRHCFSRLG